jgi:hypothetical protein
LRIKKLATLARVVINAFTNRQSAIPNGKNTFPCRSNVFLSRSNVFLLRSNPFSIRSNSFLNCHKSSQVKQYSLPD